MSEQDNFNPEYEDPDYMDDGNGSFADADGSLMDGEQDIAAHANEIDGQRSQVEKKDSKNGLKGILIKAAGSVAVCLLLIVAYGVYSNQEKTRLAQTVQDNPSVAPTPVVNIANDTLGDTGFTSDVAAEPVAVDLPKENVAEDKAAPVAVALPPSAEGHPVADGKLEPKATLAGDACPDTCKLNEEMKKMLEQMQSLTDKVNDIDARLTAHLNASGKEQSSKVSKAKTSVGEKRTKKAVSAKKQEAKEVKDTTEADLMKAVGSKVMDDSKQVAPAKEEKKVTKDKLLDDSLLIAVVPGRAFFQKRDGTRSDVSVGDVIKGCGEVVSIDAKKSEIETEHCLIH